MRILQASGTGVYALAFRPDGERIAVGGDERVHLFEPATGREWRSLDASGSGLIWDMDFSPSGRELVAATDAQAVRVWDLPGGGSRSLGDPRIRHTSVAYHPTERRVAAARADGTARIWDLEEEEEVVLRGHRDEINRVRFSADGKKVATTSADATVQLWDAETGLPYWRAPLLVEDPPQLVTHAGWINLDGRESSADAGAAVWRQEVLRDARSAAMSPDGSLVCVRRHDDRLTLWDVDRDERLLDRPAQGLQTVVATASGCHALSASGQVTYHPASGREPTVLQEEVTALSLDGDWLLTAAAGEVWSLDVDGGQGAHWLADRDVTAVARLADGIAVGYGNGNVEFLSTEGPGWTFDLEDTPSVAVTRLRAGPEETLAVGYADGTVGLWSLENGYRLHRFDLHGPVAHLALVGDSLVAVSELGDRHTLDLRVFDRDYCQLLRAVWAEVPVVWEGGAAVQRAPSGPAACL